MKKLYLLWVGDSFVDLNGTIEEDGLEGIFDSFKELNKYLKTKWFDMPFDSRNCVFDSVTKRFSKQGKQGNELYFYYSERYLNEFN